MERGSKKNSVTIGQQLRNAQGVIGIVEKIVQEFIFVRFPDGVQRMRCSSVGRELFEVQPSVEIVEEDKKTPPANVEPSKECAEHSQQRKMPPSGEVKRVNVPRQLQNTAQDVVKNRVTDDGEFAPGRTNLLVRKENNWVPAVFLRFEMKAGRKVVYVNCSGKVSFYAYPSRFVQEVKVGNAFPGEVFMYSDLSDISTIDVNIRRITDAFQKLPLSRRATADERIELPLERKYHERVSEALDVLYSAEMKKFGRSGEIEREAYLKLRDAYTYEREYGFDPFNQGFITAGLMKEDAAKIVRSAEKRMDELEKARQKPYFGRVDCGTSIDDIHTAYIGDMAIQDLVVDWRDKNIGNAFYHSGTLRGSEGIFIALKRIISFENQELFDFKDEINTYVYEGTRRSEAKTEDYAADELLLELLKESRTQQAVHDIIKSIQQNQYRMITYDLEKNILVNGCAGSGKTMILYHRLSYIAYNARAKFLPARTFVITPSELFGSVTDDLIEKLQLADINNAPYLRIIHDFIDEYAEKRHLIGREIFSSRSIDDTWSAAYDEEIYNEYQQILGNIAGDKSSFGNWAFEILSEMVEKYGFSAISADNYAKKLGSIGKLGQYEMKVFTENAWENIETSLSRSEKEQKENEKKEKEKEQKQSEKEKKENEKKRKERRETLKERRQTLKRNMLMLRAVLRHNPLKTKKGEISEAQHGFLGLLDDNETFEKLLCLTYVQKQVTEIIRFLNGGEDETVYLFLCQYALSILKERHELSKSRFDFEELYCLRALVKNFDSLSYEQAWVFVDEFQNYSLFELETLRGVYPKAIFNFYGDFSQCIQSKGVDETNIMSEFMVNCYTINENYRNAFEITQYINKKLGKAMRPIGIHGHVEETPLPYCGFKQDGRTAVIVKKIDSSVVERLHSLIPENSINLVDKDNLRLNSEKLNLMTIQDAKGLEFETVYVIDEGMSDNEKYVAYTRALNRLIVIE